MIKNQGCCCLNLKMVQNIDGSTSVTFKLPTDFLKIRSVTARNADVTDIGCATISGGTGQFYILYAEEVNAQTGNIVEVNAEVGNIVEVNSEIGNIVEINSKTINNEEAIFTDTLKATTSVQAATVLITENNIKALGQTEEGEETLTANLNVTLEAGGDLNFSTFEPPENEQGSGNLNISSWGIGNVNITTNATTGPATEDPPAPGPTERGYIQLDNLKFSVTPDEDGGEDNTIIEQTVEDKKLTIKTSGDLELHFQGTSFVGLDGYAEINTPLHLMDGEHFVCHLPQGGSSTYYWPSPPSFFGEEKKKIY